MQDSHVPCYSSFDDFNKKISTLKLNSYQVLKYSSYTKIFKLDNKHSLPFIEIYVKENLDFQIRIYSWKIRETHEIYNYSLNDYTLSALINIIEKFSVCTGIICSFSNVNVVTHTVQKNYDPCLQNASPLNQDIFYRSRNCSMLSDSPMCNSCMKCKPKVIKAENKKLANNAIPAKDKAPISQTSTERIKSKIVSLNSVKNDLLIENTNLKKNIIDLQQELNASSLKVSNELDNDMKSIFSATNEKNISPFMKLFWSEQQKYLGKSTRGIRYHPTVIKYCLSLAAKSPSTYDQMRYDEKNNSGFLILPSRRRLRDYKNYITPQRGFNKEILNELIKKTENFSENEKFVILLMDEMKIQENLVWNKHTGELVGFIDLGDTDVNFATLKDREKLASHVFLVTSLINPLKFTLANFGTDTASADQLFPLFWKAVSLLEKKCELKVMGLTCDGATQNRKLFKMHNLMSWESDLNSSIDVTYKIRNPFAQDRFIFFISDPPHLLKTLRNSLKSSTHGQSVRYLWNDGFTIAWNHISDMFYEDLECGLHLMPKVSLEHINLTSYSKMNVRLAAQVLSSTVSNVLREFAPSYTIGTANFCQIINTLFDCLNVRVPNTVKLFDDKGNVINKTRNPFVEPYTSINDFRLNWLRTDLLQYFEKWLYSIETRSGNFTRQQKSKMFIARPSYEGLKITVHSTTELIEFLLKSGVPYVLSGKFIQDCLENYFAMQRAMGRRKDNPSLYDVGYNDNTIRNSKSFKPIDGANCEGDFSNDATIVVEKLPSKKAKH